MDRSKIRHSELVPLGATVRTVSDDFGNILELTFNHKDVKEDKMPIIDHISLVSSYTLPNAMAQELMTEIRKIAEKYKII